MANNLATTDQVFVISAGFEPGINAVFMNYGWPGNFREMKNVVKLAT